jgi:hypothetical protein
MVFLVIADQAVFQLETREWTQEPVTPLASGARFNHIDEVLWAV